MTFPVSAVYDFHDDLAEGRMDGKMKLLNFGFSVIGGYWSRRHFHAVCFSEFSAMLDLYMGGCQAAPGDFRDMGYFFK